MTHDLSGTDGSGWRKPDCGASGCWFKSHWVSFFFNSSAQLQIISKLSNKNSFWVLMFAFSIGNFEGQPKGFHQRLLRLKNDSLLSWDLIPKPLDSESVDFAAELSADWQEAQYVLVNYWCSLRPFTSLINMPERTVFSVITFSTFKSKTHPQKKKLSSAAHWDSNPHLPHHSQRFILPS